VLEAVNYLTVMGVSHRDLKPANIMLDENYNVKIADFGLATQVSGNNSDTGFLTAKAGTRGYMAPEIMLKDTEYRGYQADLFALGVILFVLHSGERPFDAADVDDFYYHQLITA